MTIVEVSPINNAMNHRLLLVIFSIIFAANADAQDLPPQLTPEQVKNINAATPSLPQTPVVKRATTDSQDEGFKGKVQRVVLEDEDLSGTWNTQGRHFNSIDFYNKRGDMIEQVFFYNGHPSDVKVYGYVKGMRVSNSNTVAGHEVLSGAMSAEDRALFKATRPSDPRFSYEYRFIYDKGQLTEKDWYMSDGSLWLRYVYRRSGNEFEELVYGNDGKINQRYVSKLDERGDEIERLDVAVINKSRGDQKYRITYEAFDKNGNWIKRIKSKVLMKDGKEIVKPWYATYRTITYHSK